MLAPLAIAGGDGDPMHAGVDMDGPVQIERAQRLRALHDRSRVLRIVGDNASSAERIAQTVRRARAYLASGADCVYPIALTDHDAIARVCAEVDAPVNVGAGLPDLAELGRPGVARVSTATRLATLALSCAREAARQWRGSARLDRFDAGLGYPELQRLFAT